MANPGYKPYIHQVPGWPGALVSLAHTSYPKELTYMPHQHILSFLFPQIAHPETRKQLCVSSRERESAFVQKSGQLSRHECRPRLSIIPLSLQRCARLCPSGTLWLGKRPDTNMGQRGSICCLHQVPDTLECSQAGRISRTDSQPARCWRGWGRAQRQNRARSRRTGRVVF